MVKRGVSLLGGFRSEDKFWTTLSPAFDFSLRDPDAKERNSQLLNSYHHVFREAYHHFHSKNKKKGFRPTPRNGSGSASQARQVPAREPMDPNAAEFMPAWDPAVVYGGGGGNGWWQQYAPYYTDYNTDNAAHAEVYGNAAHAAHALAEAYAAYAEPHAEAYAVFSEYATALETWTTPSYADFSEYATALSTRTTLSYADFSEDSPRRRTASEWLRDGLEVIDGNIVLGDGANIDGDSDGEQPQQNRVRPAP